MESAGLDSEVFTVPMNWIDREISESSLPEPDIVKIDVEGVELDVLHGMTETIARRKPRLFVEIHGSDAERQTRQRGTS